MQKYLEMCEEARELQAHWKPDRGDRMFLREDLYAHGTKLTSVATLGEYLVYPKGFYHINDITRAGKNMLGVDDPKTFFSFCTFVPYQEQLQEKLFKNFDSIKTLITKFNMLALSSHYGDLLIATFSYNELWLMLYQYIVHQKEWDGETWIVTEVNNVGKLYNT